MTKNRISKAFNIAIISGVVLILTAMPLTAGKIVKQGGELKFIDDSGKVFKTIGLGTVEIKSKEKNVKSSIITYACVSGDKSSAGVFYNQKRDVYEGNVNVYGTEDTVFKYMNSLGNVTWEKAGVVFARNQKDAQVISGDGSSVLLFEGEPGNVDRISIYNSNGDVIWELESEPGEIIDAMITDNGRFGYFRISETWERFVLFDIGKRKIKLYRLAKSARTAKAEISKDGKVEIFKHVKDKKTGNMARKVIFEYQFE